MSSVTNLIFAGQVIGEWKDLITGIVANGSSYFKDLVYLPQLVKAGEDAAVVLQNRVADLDEVKALDEAGRAQLAAAWGQALHYPADAGVDTIIQEGVVVISYGFEALGFFLRSQTPTVAKTTT